MSGRDTNNRLIRCGDDLQSPWKHLRPRCFFPGPLPISFYTPMRSFISISQIFDYYYYFSSVVGQNYWFKRVTETRLSLTFMDVVRRSSSVGRFDEMSTIITDGGTYVRNKPVCIPLGHMIHRYEAPEVSPWQPIKNLFMFFIILNSLDVCYSRTPPGCAITWSGEEGSYQANTAGDER